MNILLTGSAGLIGRHLYPMLKERKYNVCRVDPKQIIETPFDWRWTIEQWIAAYGHSDHKFDAIIHLAANIVNIEDRFNGGVSQYENIAIDLAVCNYAERHPPAQFIALSSCAVDNIQDPYALSKLALNGMCHKLNKKTAVALLIPYSGYAEDQSEEYPFGAILARAIRRDNPLIVWGNGEQTRDFVHVDDICKSIIASIENRTNGKVLIGTGRGTSMRDLAWMITRQVGYDTTVQCMGEKPMSSLHRVAPYGQFDNMITLEEGIRRAVEYAKSKR